MYKPISVEINPFDNFTIIQFDDNPEQFIIVSCENVGVIYIKPFASKFLKAGAKVHYEKMQRTRDQPNTVLNTVFWFMYGLKVVD